MKLFLTHFAQVEKVSQYSLVVLTSLAESITKLPRWPSGTAPDLRSGSLADREFESLPRRTSRFVMRGFSISLPPLEKIAFSPCP